MYDPHHPARDTDEPREPQESADPRRWKALAVICVAQFMLILDLTVVNVALPDLGASSSTSRSASSCWPPSRPWCRRAATRTAPPGASTCSAG
jgi:hypothetical protein